ncbi:MAG TPA: SCO family protein [Burkholderiales bacterium]|nr:SCO family protein [Burkholderiales bacterium]
MTTIWRFSGACLLAALVSACTPEGPKFRSTDVTGADFGRALTLTGHDGKPHSLEEFRGKAVVLFFGYTHCPDICPTTLADTAAALKKLGADASRVQVLFVTVDPERDTPQVLAQYVPAFDPSFLGLYGDAQATQRAAKEFRIFYAKNSSSTPGSYTVDHSAQTFVFDPQGRLRLLVRPERIPQDLAADLQTLLKSSS